MIFNEFFAKRRVKRILQRYVSKETAQAITEGRQKEEAKIQAGRIDFIFVLLRVDGPEQFSEHVAAVVDLCVKHGSTVDGLVGPMVIMTFGMLPIKQDATLSRIDLVKALQQQCGENIRIVHGTAGGHFGIFGGKLRKAFTFTVPCFPEILAKLGTMEFGQTEEIIL